MVPKGKWAKFLGGYVVAWGMCPRSPRKHGSPSQMGLNSFKKHVSLVP